MTQSSISAGTTQLFEPLNNEHASAINVSYAVTTTENTRTVTIRYTAVEDTFVKPALYELEPPLPSYVFNYLRFRVSVFDEDWDGDAETAFFQAELYGDEHLLNRSPVFPSPDAFLAPSYIGYSGLNGANPASPYFFQDSPYAPDDFIFFLTYNIIPSPSSFLITGVAFTPLLCTRRGRVAQRSVSTPNRLMEHIASVPDQEDGRG